MKWKKILIIWKFPPIQWGVSSKLLSYALTLKKYWNEVIVLTNSNEIDIKYKTAFLEKDKEYFNKLTEGIKFYYLDDFDYDEYYHIPFSKAYSERFFGKWLEIINDEKIDVIVGSYLQPYWFSTILLWKFFSLPVAIHNARSDVWRVWLNKDLKKTYDWIIKNADYHLNNPISNIKFNKFLWIPDNVELSFFSKIWLPSFFYEKNIESFSIYEYINLFEKNYQKYFPYDNKKIFLNKKKINKNIPILWWYWKIDETRGIYDLLNSLDNLNKKWIKFQFICIFWGYDFHLLELYNFVLKLEPRLLDNIWFIPFIPYFKIPSFLKFCDILFFLERKFRIKGHLSFIPIEVISSWKCLISSKKKLNSFFWNCLVDNKDYLYVDNFDNLTNKIEDLILTKKYLNIWNNAKKLFKKLQIISLIKK